MRSALLKFFAVMTFGLAAGAHAQINPGTQIGWPTGCNAPNQAYSFYTKGCITISNAGLTGLPTTGGTMTGPIGFAGGALASPATTTLNDLGGLSAVLDSLQTPVGPMNIDINSQCNVMVHGAVGDCSTDDHTAIQACMNQQLTSTSQVTVLFPAPPGGCYLTSTLTYTGASMQGQAGAGFVGQIGAGVVIRGKPSQDILHIPDPTTVGSVGPRSGWSIRDIVFSVDDSVDASASFPHRKPGRTVQDGAINASSTQFSSTKAEFTCGDTGQNILVYGAGSGGSNLSTTIAAVSPCWNNGSATQITATATTVTLTAAASTSVTNAYAYITPANIPVATTLGNCGIAADNYDGNSANWHMTGGTGTFNPQLWNVTFTSNTQSHSHNECAVYFGATWAPYMMDAKNVWVWNMNWGIVQGLVDTNPTLGVAGQDYQKWDHGWIYANYPWISYNGGLNHLEDIQLTALNGPQILQVAGSNEQAPNGWLIHVPEFETATGVGWRIEGYQATVIGTELCDGRTASINTMNSRFIQSDCGGYLNLNGSNNWIDGAGIPQPNITDKGVDNIYEGTQHQGPSGMVTTTVQAQTLNRGRQAFGTLTPDFIRNGTAPYYSDHDLWIWPQDFTDIYGYQFNVAADTNSWTGNYAAIPVGGYDLLYFNNMYMLGRPISSCNTGGNCNQIYAGQNIPAGPVLVEFSYKCPSISTFNATIKAYGSGTPVSSVTATSCSTTYATQTISADFTSYTGQALDLSLSTGEVDIAWMAVVPIGSSTFLDVNTENLEVTGGLTAITNSLQAGGSFPAVTGCGTISAQQGGTLAGTFNTTATTCTPVLSGLPASVYGKICFISDRTHPFSASVLMNITGTSTTATFGSFTTTAGDQIAFSCPLNY